MIPTLSDLFNSPDHYFHSIVGDDALFLRMDRAAYRRSIFLDDRISPSAEGALRVPLDTLLAHPVPVPRAGWIFHVAHCGSTLLARALEDMSDGLVLREPLGLRQVAVAQAGMLLPLTLAMLGKRYRDAGVTVIKANVPVNFILPDIAALTPAAPAILLYLDWREYLAAILRSDGHRVWLRSVTAELANELSDLVDLSELGDGERAAALWAAQMTRFHGALRAMPNARGLDAEQFFAEPAGSLRAAAGLFGLEVGDAARTAGGSVFTTYSKDPGASFSNDDRLIRRRESEIALRGELARAEAWLGRHAPASAGHVAALRDRPLAG